MQSHKTPILPALSITIEKARKLHISQERREILQALVDYIQEKVNQSKEINLNFICTHNSRRSQFSQVWAQTASSFFDVQTNCYSGGVEVTAFNERAVLSLKRDGFKISSEEGENPIYFISISDDGHSIKAFSKTFDDPTNKASQFAAIMTCSHADDNCPFIPGTEKRIPVRYEDPKKFDDTPQEEKKYDERSMQIASEMFYVFSKIEI